MEPQELKLKDIDTVLAALSDIREILDTLVEGGLDVSPRRFLRAPLTMVTAQFVS